MVMWKQMADFIRRVAKEVPGVSKGEKKPYERNLVGACRDAGSYLRRLTWQQSLTWARN